MGLGASVWEEPEPTFQLLTTARVASLIHDRRDYFIKRLTNYSELHRLLTAHATHRRGLTQP